MPQAGLRWKSLLHPDIWIGLAVLVLLTLPFVFTDLDLKVSGWYWRQDWFAGERPLWLWLYRWGPLPGLLLSAAALGILAWSWLKPSHWSWRRPALRVPKPRRFCRRWQRCNGGFSTSLPRRRNRIRISMAETIGPFSTER